MYNGILIVDKPTDWTSFDVIAKLRGVLATRKIGHSGTLDPMATGVLPLFVGSAARAVDMQNDHTKAYRATIRFGLKTDTGDITGTVVQSTNCNMSAEKICDCLPKLIGKQQQIPPMYSAIKINGQPLYKLARKGLEIERKPRDIEIFDITYISQTGQNEFVLDIKCSKGTYIRVLLEDIAAQLGTIATMANLVRTQSGVYTLENAKTLQQIIDAKENNTVAQFFLPVASVFTHLTRLDASERLATRLKNGAPTRINKPEGEYAVFFEDQFVCVAEVLNDDCIIKKSFFGK